MEEKPKWAETFPIYVETRINGKVMYNIYQKKTTLDFTCGSSSLEDMVKRAKEMHGELTTERFTPEVDYTKC